MAHSKTDLPSKRTSFAQPKKKVGKPRRRPINTTNTNFQARSIVVTQQISSLASRSLQSQVETNIKLLTSHSEGQRRESLNALLNIEDLKSVPLAKLLPVALSLMVDSSRCIREQLLKLLQRLPCRLLLGYEQHIVLHIQVGLTHISSEICKASLAFLDWAMSTFGPTLLGCKGGWFSLLKSFILLFGWNDLDQPRISPRSHWNGRISASTRLSKDDKALHYALRVFSKFLQSGLAESEENGSYHYASESFGFDDHMKPHMLQCSSKDFAQLCIFSNELDENRQAFVSPNDRRALLRSSFLPKINKGLDLTRIRGGEAGRIAASIEKILRQYID